MTRRPAFILLMTIQLLAACGSTDTETPASPGVEGAEAGVESAVAEEGVDPAAEDKASEKTASQPPAQVDEPGPGPMPPSFAGIHEILKVASAAKEPNNQHFNQHSQPTVALRWFARYGSSEHVRIFALRALGLYPTPGNALVLSKVAMNESESSPVRAGAIRGLGRYDLEDSRHQEVKKFIFTAVSGEDLELSCAAADAMHGMPTARPVLLALSEGADTAPLLKAAAKRALGPQVE